MSATQVAGAVVAPRPRPIQIDFPGFDLGPTDTVLDVGCGWGDVCAYAGSLGADVIGVDLLDHLVAHTRAVMADTSARSFHGYTAAAESLPLEDACADAIVCTEVLEHVDDPIAAARELARVGRPGAHYLISVPDPASESLMRCVAPDWYFRSPFHVRVFEHEDLDRLLEGAGLEVVGRHAGGFYWSIHWLLRLAVGMENPYEPAPAHPAIDGWDESMRTLAATAGGREALSRLDRLVPKSQVVVARKAGRASRRGVDAAAPWRALRRRVRDGRTRIGRFAISWSVRRA